MAQYFTVSDVPAEEIELETPANYTNILSKKDKSFFFVQGSPLSKEAYMDGSNSFVNTAIKAYCHHHNLTIRPDDVWIAICNQFSNYVNANSEKLRSKFVDFKDKKTLTVYTQGCMMTGNYNAICDEMASQIADNIKDSNVRDWLTPNFTTTTNVDRMAAIISLMATMKSFFNYQVFFECNLPGVTLLGTPNDWMDIRKRADKLLEYELENMEITKWTKMLFPVLDKLVKTSKLIAENKKDLIDKNWWNRIANYFGGGSGPSYASGWITVFCVFNNDGKYQATNFNRDSYVYNEIMNKYEERIEIQEWPIIDTNNIPYGYVCAPVYINDNGAEYNTKLIAGHIFAECLNDTTIAPKIDWVLFAESKK